MEIKIFNLNPIFGTNTYLLYKNNNALVIDPAGERIRVQELIDFANKNNLNISMILLTHGHCDHIGGVNIIKKIYNSKLMIHKNDVQMLVNPEYNLSLFTGEKIVCNMADAFLEDNEEIDFEGEKIKIIHTPGHTQGGVCFLTNKYLFSGDTLFDHSIGRSDLPGGNQKQLINFIKEKLFILEEDIIVYPGHGRETSIKIEKQENPYVGINL